MTNVFPTVVAVYQQTLLLWLPVEGLALKWKDGKCKLFRGLRVVRMTRLRCGTNKTTVCKGYR